MSATMARQGGQVQLAQFDMRLALNVAKMAKRGLSCTVIKEMHHLIKKRRAKVREEKTRGVQFPGDKKVKEAIESYPALFMKIEQTSAFLAKMAQQRIGSHTGEAKARVHLNHDRRHLGSKYHLCHLVKESEIKALI